MMPKEIPLTQGKFAIVDDDDHEYLSQFKWHYHKDGYAVRNVRLGVNKRTAVMMHREIMKTPIGMDTDHIDGNGLNNQKHNLRICKHKFNMRNQKKRRNSSSKYKGVTFHKLTGKWSAQIGFDGKLYHLGLFEDERKAALAYNKMAKKHYGEYARINDL